MHTSRYHHVLLNAVPQPCRRALDIGCGSGAFARLLARVADQVDAIDRDPQMIARARLSSGDIPNLQLICADFVDSAENDLGTYDFISSLASLHHLPFSIAAARIKQMLRPNGVFAAIGLYRSSGIVDLLWSLAAFPISRLLRLTHGRQQEPMPLRDPDLTLDEIRRHADALLPGAVLKRRLLWRYTLVYTHPAPSHADDIEPLGFARG